MNATKAIFSCLLMLCLYPLFVTAQPPKRIDSLRAIINRSNTPDTTLARSLLLLSDNYFEHHADSTILYAEKALVAVKHILSAKPDPKVKKQFSIINIQALNNIGYAWHQKGFLNKALKYNYKALDIATTINDSSQIAECLNTIGWVKYSQGDIKEALIDYHKSMRIYELLGDEEGVSVSVNNIGIIHEDQDDLEKALDYYQRSLAISEKLGLTSDMATHLNNIGGIYNKMGDVEKALEYCIRCLKIDEERGDTYGIISSMSNIGMLYKHRGDVDKAIEMYEKSLKLSEGSEYKTYMSTILVNLGNAYVVKEDYPKAEQYGLQSLEWGQRLGYAEDVQNAAELLSRVYEKQNKGMDALRMHRLHDTMRDSLHNEKTEQVIAEQEAKYIYDKQKALDDAENQKKLAVEREKQEKQKLITYATGGGLALLVVFLIIVFNRLKVISRQKNMIESKNLQLSVKNQEITDSMNYAKRIQSAILPPDKVVNQHLQDSFILYKPKDIVAGDFYWMDTVPGKTEDDETVLFSAADCTGHGVPGAMVSVVCNNGLNRSVREFGIVEPGKILDKTREIVLEEFAKSEDEVNDGMDIALCALKGHTLQYAGAHNPLWIIRDGELLETKANRQPIGKFQNSKPYTTHTVELQKGDSIYVFTDGFADQFGGPRGKKFMSKRFKDLLISLQDEDMPDQKAKLEQSLENWMKETNTEQVDDICVVGVRV